MSDSLSGTVSFQKQAGPLNSIDIQSSAEVVVNHDARYSLSFTVRSLKQAAFFQLLDHSGTELQTWHFEMGLWTKRLDLSLDPGHPLHYEMRVFGRTFFVTAEEKIRTFMNLSGGSRSFVLDDMKFIHFDFQSEIQFTAPRSKLYQAILIASLLFNPPGFGDGD